VDILEQLKRERAQRDGAGSDALPASEAGDAPAVLERALERLFAGLERLAEGLRELHPDVRVDYALDGVGKLTGMQQQDYAVLTVDAALPRFAFTFKCVGQKSVSRIADSSGQKDVISQALESHLLDVRIDDLSTWRYVITVMPMVPVRLLFEPGPDGASIRVTARNLDGLGSRIYSLHPDVVRNELFNEIGKLVLRRENRFAEFAGNIVSGDIREGLQQRVRARQESREQESASTQSEPRRRGLKDLLRGRDAAAPAPPRRAAAGAPNLNDAGDADPGIIEWDGATPAPKRQARPPAPAAPAATLPGAAQAVHEAPCYAWLVTADVKAADTSASVGRRGPPGADPALTTSRVLNEGQEFRLLSRDGEVRYLGKIAGKYQGVEPLVDFGIARECYVIQYRRGGEWVRVRPTD